MKRILFAFGLLVFSNSVYSQTTWSNNAAEVIFNKCTSCHNPGGIAPFSLLTYNDAYTYRIGILSSVGGNTMPPWTADTSYQKYSHERFLSGTEKDAIMNWINQGAVSGNLTQAPPTPVYNSGAFIQAAPDLQLKMPNYISKATSSSDDYVCIVVPSGLIADKKFKAIEVIPGNYQTVHHALIYKADAGSHQTDTSGFCGSPQGTSAAQLVAGYTPGATPTIFPSGGSFKSGITINSGDDIIFSMHYPIGSAGQLDSTKVNIYFYPDGTNGVREIYAEPLLDNWSFCLDSNEIETVTDIYPSTGGTTYDASLLSVFPHMHLLGSSIKSYAISPLTDTIPFVNIPIWDFDWQDFYFFEKPQHVPAGSVLHAEGVYNNKAGANPHFPNPNPVQVCAGFNTSDEMFLVYFHFMLYAPGDENINVDSLNAAWFDSLSNLNPASINTIEKDDLNLSVYPNPFNNQTSINYTLKENAFVSLYIYDTRGVLVNKLVKNNQVKGNHNIVWDGKNMNGNELTPGLYHYAIKINNKQTNGKVVLSR
jgi:hypothetical protein